MLTTSSSEKVKNSSDCGREYFSVLMISGNSSRQGSQNVAQKFTRNGTLCCFVTRLFNPSVSIFAITGFGTGVAEARFLFWAGAARLANNKQATISTTTLRLRIA